MVNLRLGPTQTLLHNLLSISLWIGAGACALALYYRLPTEGSEKCYSLGKIFYGRGRLFAGTILLHIMLSGALILAHVGILSFGLPTTTGDSEGSTEPNATQKTRLLRARELISQHLLDHEKAKGLVLMIAIGSWSALSFASLALPIHASKVFSYVNDESKMYGDGSCNFAPGLVLAYILLTVAATFFSLHVGFLLSAAAKRESNESEAEWYGRMPKWGQPQWGALSYIYYALLVVVFSVTIDFYLRQDMFNIGRDKNKVEEMFKNATGLAPLRVNFTHYNVTRDLIFKYSSDYNKYNDQRPNWADVYVGTNLGMSALLLLLAIVTTILLHVKSDTTSEPYSKFSRSTRAWLFHSLSVFGFAALVIGLMFASSTALPLVIQDYGDVANAVWKNSGIQDWKKDNGAPLFPVTPEEIRKHEEKPNLLPEHRLVTVVIWWLLAIISSVATFTVSMPGGFGGKYGIAQPYSTSADPEGQPLVHTVGAVAGAVMGTARSHRTSDRW